VTILGQAKEIIANGCGCDRMCDELVGADVYCGCEEDAKKVLALVCPGETSGDNICAETVPNG
jgi:hypothetical protein